MAIKTMVMLTGPEQTKPVQSASHHELQLEPSSAAEYRDVLYRYDRNVVGHQHVPSPYPTHRA